MMLTERIESLCGTMDVIPTGEEPKLTKLSGIKAVVFDVYGTLLISGSGDVGTAIAVDSSAALSESLAAAGFEGDLEKAGIRGKELLREFIEHHHHLCKLCSIWYPEVDIIEIWTKVLAELHKEGILTTEVAELEKIKALGVEYECRVNPTWPMPDCTDLLSNVAASEKVMGIVSNAQFYTPLLFETFFDKKVSALGFDPECCIWSCDVGEGKPSHKLFDRVLGTLMVKYNIRAEETVYVGNDMLNDVSTAQKAGCKTVLFAGDNRSLRWREGDERVAGIEPDAVITELSQLNEVLG
ncbi:HAD family hydrolase [Verrucomicrobiota bacterium]